MASSEEVLLHNPVPLWPVDGHVHFHRVERVGVTLDAAAENFRAVNPEPRAILGALLLAEAAGERVFAALTVGPALGGWRFEVVPAERETLLARKGDAAIAIVCGRQVRSRGGLEVLGLGTCVEFSDSKSFEETIEDVRASGALIVLPWGFGKWLGKRGQWVRTMLRASPRGVLSIGDNGGRLGVFGVPSLIRESESRGFRVVPGSDPFPFGGDYCRVGAFGFMTAAHLDVAAPWRSLREWLDSLSESPPRFGNACGSFRFVVNQVGMQVRNRFIRRIGR
jgi:hypothetical protein